ncbi:MAG: amylo-alpha-1,6-glucosidase [Salinibacter sp.]|uniref:amylo-alpha-1,6-glucosidase n=1 Tax=Salinibacter sp. TaxID=2065818 RepID=UPI0035D4B320
MPFSPPLFYRRSTILLIGLVLAGGLVGCRASDGPTRVGYVLSAKTPSPVDTANLSWLASTNGLQTDTLRASNLSSARLEGIDVVWVHAANSSAYGRLTANGQLRPLRRAFEDGMRVLATNHAARLPYDLGIESNAPSRRVRSVQNREHNDKKGLQSFRGHPLFTRGLLGGDQLWDATQDHRLSLVGYFGTATPDSGRVLAVERARTAVRRQNKLAIEHTSEAGGRMLSVGAFVYLNRPNNLRVKLEQFLKNAVHYLDGTLDGAPSTYWRYHENLPRRFTGPQSPPIEPSPDRALTDRPRTDLAWHRSAPSDEFFDVAGRRAIIMGTENGGLREVWTHPFKLLYNYETGVVRGDSVAWLDELPVEITARPEAFVRHYDLGPDSLRQVIYPGLQASGGVVHYRSTATDPVRLVIRFQTNFNYMWPYPKNSLGNLYYRHDEGLNALRVRDTTGTFYAFMGGDIAPEAQLSGAYSSVRWTPEGLEGAPADTNLVTHAATYRLDDENNHTLVYGVAGSNEGEDAVEADYRRLVGAPREVYADVVQHYETLLDQSATIVSPDSTFNRLYRWALVGSDRFGIATPHLGRGLMAGYGFSNPQGGAWASGTPGYGWYFGRDAVWSGLAVNAYGDTDLVRDQLQLLQENQDLRGKIYHALNTAGPGVKQFNAADSTPLYVLLMADYIRTSGNRAFLRESWPHVKRAMDFLRSTDTDGDGLIENTNVGHGWIELGELNEAHSTFYLSSLWWKALTDAAYLAGLTGRDSLRRSYRQQADRVYETLNTDFWNPDQQFFAQAKNRNGSFNDAVTVMPAVGMDVGAVEPAKADPVLDALASNRFSSDWGVRIIDRTSSLYDPSSYHLGTVWPLFTGWTALAEYKYGRPAQGYRHVRNNLYVKHHWAAGFIEEVLNGNRYEPNGFSPHQAWSETNSLLPLLEGMVGWTPVATEQRARLAPQFPAAWDTVAVRNLQVGDTHLRLNMSRTDTTTRYRVVRQQGPPVTVEFAPGLPAGTSVQAIRVSGKSVSRSDSTAQGVLAPPIRFEADQQTDIVLDRTGGVAALAKQPSPSPGDRSQGYRVISTAVEGATARITVEGRAGTTEPFRVRVFDQAVSSVEGGTLQSVADGIARINVPFAATDGRFARKTLVLALDPR